MNKIVYKLLIVEDNPADITLIKIMLNKLYNIRITYFEAHTISEAMDVFARNSIDIILLDLNLPDSHGINTFLTLYKKMSDIPIIVLSGQDDEALAIETVKKGAQDYLVKNQVDGAILCKAIRYAVERKKTEMKLRHRIEFERLIGNISTKFINLSYNKIDAGIKEALKELGEALEVDNCCLYQFTKNTHIISGTHMWSKNRKYHYLKNYNLDSKFHEIIGMLKEHDIFYKSTFSENDELQNALCDFFRVNTIKSVFFIPIIAKRKLFGFLSLYTQEEEKLVSNDEVILLKFVGNIFLTALEQKWSNKALMDSEEKYRKMINTITDYTYTVKINDDKVVKTTHSNACIAVTGYSPEEFDSNPYLWIQMVHHEDNSKVNGLTDQIVTEKNVEPIEHRIIRKDGQIRWVKNTPVIHYDTKGNIVAYTGLIQDITEKKEIELKLEEEHAMLSLKVKERTIELINANKELLHSSRLKDEFLASMSHELRTPLNSILGISEVLLEEIYGPINDEQKKALQIVENSGKHLLDLINDILDLSKIEAGELTLSKGPVHLESILTASISFIKQISARKNQQIIQEINSSLNYVYADERRLKQILVNLLSNAAKFTDKNGKIGIIVDYEDGTDFVSFTIWDTGIGIEPDNMDIIFKPFTQVDSSLARKHNGTGLGLSLVRRLIDMHGGVINVDSEVGKGTRFKIILPGQNKIQIDEKDKVIPDYRELYKDESAGHDRPAIMLVEDNEFNIMTISDFLISKKYNLYIARSGVEAIELLEKLTPNVILMDIQLPQMDGIEVIKRIRKDDKKCNIPIIAVSALAMPGDKEKCIKAGANDYMSKPLKLKSLLQKIESFITVNKEV